MVRSEFKSGASFCSRKASLMLELGEAFLCQKLALSEPHEYVYGESKGHPLAQGIAMWYVYILCCRDGSLYTGSTTDISRRIKEHNCAKGGSYTRVRLPVTLIHKEYYLTRSEAQNREAQIKRWTRKKKIALIYYNKSQLKQLSKSK